MLAKFLLGGTVIAISETKSIMPGPIYGGSIAGLLTPLWGAYEARRYHDAKADAGAGA